MVYANIDFPRKSQFVKAVREGESVVLWDSAANQPAVNGVVVVEAWSNFTDREYWRDGRRVTQPAGWHCRVRVQNGDIKEILDEDVTLLAARSRMNAMLASACR